VLWAYIISAKIIHYLCYDLMCGDDDNNRGTVLLPMHKHTIERVSIMVVSQLRNEDNLFSREAKFRGKRRKIRISVISLPY
jgi:hypothetical protein